MKKYAILLFVLVVGFLILGRGVNLSGTSAPKLSSPTPTPYQSSEVPSPDGSKKVILKSYALNNGSTVYSVYTSDGNGLNKSLIFSKTISKGSIFLPGNSWSPDNKYLFIEDREGADNYLVFKSSGLAFADGEKYLNATSLFDTKVKNFTLKSMTGWDDPVLMSVWTTNGTHFWFAVETQNFIQLVR